MIDTHLQIDCRALSGNKLKVKRLSDNWILFKLYSGGAVVNLAQRSNLEIRLSDDSNLYSISEKNSPLNFYITGNAGEVMIRIGKTAAPIGFYNFSLWYYDINYSSGVIFGINQNFICEIA